VIQWTYWNGNYFADSNPVGSHDKRANATMEGCFDGTTCTSLSAPQSGSTTTLEFKSELKHWFYSNLDHLGTPDFETTSKYEALADGSLKLSRSVVRRPWHLNDINVRTWTGSAWSTAHVADTYLTSTN